MGTLYASILWEIRNGAKAAYGDKGLKTADTAFTNHLALLNSNSTFSVACTQHIPSAYIAVLGKSEYEAKYKAIVDKQCQRVPTQ